MFDGVEASSEKAWTIGSDAGEGGVDIDLVVVASEEACTT